MFRQKNQVSQVDCYLKVEYNKTWLLDNYIWASEEWSKDYNIILEQQRKLEDQLVAGGLIVILHTIVLFKIIRHVMKKKTI